VAAFAIPACYQHVEEVQELALCTQPHYNFTSHAAYFEGEPPYPHRTSLVDAFLLYHTQLQGGGAGWVVEAYLPAGPAKGQGGEAAGGAGTAYPGGGEIGQGGHKKSRGSESAAGKGSAA
jgi:hypothetical protein